MSTNLFSRLRGLLPAEPVILARVVSHDATDDTSLLELPLGLPLVPVTLGVSTGGQFRARGRGVAVGQNAFVRGGVVESQAPAGEPTEIVVGDVVVAPEGPQGIAFSGTVPAQAATVGVPFDLDLTGYFSGYYPALTWALTAGSLTGSGLVLEDGHIVGTPSGAAALSGLTVAATDATGLSASTGAFAITVS